MQARKDILFSAGPRVFTDIRPKIVLPLLAALFACANEGGGIQSIRTARQQAATAETSTRQLCRARTSSSRKTFRDLGPIYALSSASLGGYGGDEVLLLAGGPLLARALALS